MKKTVIILLIFTIGLLTFNCSQSTESKNTTLKSVYLEYDKAMPQAVYAAKKLKEALTRNGYYSVDESS
jgi:hypothetical protein